MEVIESVMNSSDAVTNEIHNGRNSDFAKSSLASLATSHSKNSNGAVGEPR